LAARWAKKVQERVAEPMQIALEYDRTTLAVNEHLRCTVTVNNNTLHSSTWRSWIWDPPGFDVNPAAFEAMREQAKSPSSN